MKFFRNQARFMWLLIGLLMLAACGPDAVPVKGVATDIQISYKREGGIAGITQEWTIYPDGRIVGPDGQEMNVPPRQVISLLAKASELDSSNMQESYVPDDACCDQFIYTIVVKVGDEVKMLQTSDGAKQPEQITSLFTSIENLISPAEPAK